MARRLIIGIDLGGTNLKIALLDFNFRIKSRLVLDTRRLNSQAGLISAIADSIDLIIEKNNLSKKFILGVGLGVPGPVDPKRGIVHFFPNITGFKNLKIKEILQKKIKLPVFLDNDAKLMSLAEQRIGAAKGKRNALCLTLGTGVGGGIIINAELFRGASNAAGEIGHLPINEEGPKCNCGGSGCLEAYIGNNRIKKAARWLFKRDISLEELSSLAKKGNIKAKKIWQEVAKHLGIALSAAVNLLNPEVIVIGGGVSNAGEVLFNKVRNTIRERAMPVQAAQVRVVKAKLKSDAGLIGAAIMVRESFLKK